MDPLPVIPSPPVRRFYAFRVHYLPAIVFACTLLTISHLWREHVLPPPIAAQKGSVMREIRAHQTTETATNLFVGHSQAITDPSISR